MFYTKLDVTPLGKHVVCY